MFELLLLEIEKCFTKEEIELVKKAHEYAKLKP